MVCLRGYKPLQTLSSAAVIEFCTECTDEVKVQLQASSV
jgi:hypothetical protein